MFPYSISRENSNSSKSVPPLLNDILGSQFQQWFVRFSTLILIFGLFSTITVLVLPKKHHIQNSKITNYAHEKMCVHTKGQTLSLSKPQANHTSKSVAKEMCYDHLQKQQYIWICGFNNSWKAWLQATKYLLLMTEVVATNRRKVIYQLISSALARPGHIALQLKGWNSW